MKIFFQRLIGVDVARVAVRVRVYGKVQGVFFRASMKEMADTLGVNGWVRNNPDGSVESFIVGEESKVRELVEWCKKGPPLAKVTKIETWNEEPVLEKRGFHIVR